MRRLVAALVVLGLALTLTACGGGGDKTAEEATPTATAAAPAPAANGEEITDPIPDRSLEESSPFVPFPSGDFVPTSVADKLAAKEPMLLFFYDAAQKDTDEQRKAIEAVIDENQGLVSLLSYDLGKYTSIDAYGNAVVDTTKLDKDAKGKQAIELAKALGVSFTPYIVIVDDQGYITWKARGFADQSFIEREVLRASK